LTPFLKINNCTTVKVLKMKKTYQKAVLKALKQINELKSELLTEGNKIELRDPVESVSTKMDYYTTK
jgi:hypothetical protein